jgi:hypothetical protein
VSIGWKRGRFSGELSGRVELRGESVAVVADRFTIAKREVTIPMRWRRRRALPTASLSAIGAKVRDVTVREDAVVVALAFDGWSEPITYEQLVRLQLHLVDQAGRVVVDLVRGRSR